MRNFRHLHQKLFCQPQRFNSTSAAASTKISTSPVDTLIIGGGPMGACTAYHLAQQEHKRSIVVLEQDPTYQSSCSAVLSAGGLRQQFSLPENIQMSLYGREFLQALNIPFVEAGYLFLTSSAAHAMEKNHSLRRSLGCHDHILLGQDELRERFPWLNVEDLKLGSFGQRGEGWLDPWQFLQVLKQENIKRGVQYLAGKSVGATRDADTGRIVSVQVQGEKTGTYSIPVNNVVNAAGAFAGQLLDQLAGEDSTHEPLPVRPRKRCIFFFHSKSSGNEAIVPALAPLTVDPSLVYFRSEGAPGAGNFLCGVSPDDDKDEDYEGCLPPPVTEDDYQQLFYDRIWPALYHRVPAFGELKLKSAWAGLYDTNYLDQNAILGCHPDLPNLFLTNGFSGHGLQQSPAAGRAVAELIDKGEFVTLNLDRFRFDRCSPGGPPLVWETAIV